MSAAMAGLAGWVLEALIASALLMVLVLIARGPVRQAFGPRIAYALWALPLLRLALPPLPPTWRAAAATPISRASETVIVVLSDAPAATTAAPAPVATVVMALIAVWIAGAATFLAYHLFRHARFCRRIVATAERVGLEGDIRVVTSAAAPGPLAFGLWHRYVAFPADFAERYDADERALALAHEVGHHRRGDLAANWAALAVLALHWFNPLAWRAFHAFRADQELANDARVLAGRSPVERHIYACAIVKAAHGGAASAACHLHTITDLKGRLKMLSLSPASRRRLASGGIAVAGLVVAGLGLTASGSSAAAISAGMKEAVAQAAPPVPPVPPAPLASTAVPAPIAPSDAATAAAAPRKVKKVVIVKDGKTNTYEGAEADAYLAAHPMPETAIPPEPGKHYQIFMRDADGHLAQAKPGQEPTIVTRRIERVGRYGKDGKPGSIDLSAMPTITSMNCPDATSREAVIHDKKNGKERILICTNRIETMSREGQRVAMTGEEMARGARLSARASLMSARAAIEADRNLTPDQKKQALAGIDQARAELDAGKN